MVQTADILSSSNNYRLIREANKTRAIAEVSLLAFKKFLAKQNS
jgi:hypothetical protein